MVSKRRSHTSKSGLDSQTAFLVQIRMFSDRSASQLHLFANTKLQIPRKGHQIRGCCFFPASSRVRPKLGQMQAKSQPQNAGKSMPTPPKKRPLSPHPPRASPKSLPNSKRSLSGVPGPSPEAPERSPRAPRAPLERPRDASGAPPEVARSAQRMQQGTGDLKTSPWHLKKLNPEAPGPSFRSFRVRFCELFRLLLGHPRTQVSKAAPQRKLPGGGGESPQASSIVLYIRRPLGQGVSELVLGGGFTSPYPLRLDPGASRAALPMAISLCLSRKSRSLGPQNAQNGGAKGGGDPSPGGLGLFPLLEGEMALAFCTRL